MPVTFADGASDDLTVGAIYDDRRHRGRLPAAPSGVDAARATQDVDTTGARRPAPTAVAWPTAGRRSSRWPTGYGGPDVEDRDEYAATIAAGVDMLLTIVYVLLALAIVIALMGIANTLSLSIHERTRELGLLRAVGQTRRQLRAMVRWESVIIAVFGAVGGIGLGVFLGWALVQAAGTASGGHRACSPCRPARLAIVLVVGAIAGVLAGLRPARRAARLDVLAAIATE